MHMLRALPADLEIVVQGLWKGVLPSLVMVSDPTHSMSACNAEKPAC